MSKNMRSKQEWFSLIGRCESSGLRVREFCEIEGVHPSSYYFWAKRYKEKELGFAPLEIIPTNSSQYVSAHFCELVYPNGTMLRICQKVSLGELAQLLKLF